MDTAHPLACQRHLFEMPPDVSYLDAAAWTPVPRPVRNAGEAGMVAKRQPWAYPREETAAWADRARTAAARLVGAEADDMAIVGSVAYAMATAARNIHPAPGGRLLRVADEFPSHRLVWDSLAADRDLVVEEVPRPADADWTAALLQAIARPGAPPLAIATLTPLHWSDGARVDLDRVAPAVHAAGGALVVDATQAVGVLPVDVARWRPDFLAFPTYKWVLGPYSAAFLYVAPHRQDGHPLEQHSANGPAAAGARRFDKGERNEPVALPMAATAMELVLDWGVAAIAARLRQHTDRLAEDLAALGLDVVPRGVRSPHILGARMPGGLPPNLVERLADDGVFVSERLGGVRLSPHVWTDDRDVGRAAEMLRTHLGRRTP